MSSCDVGREEVRMGLGQDQVANPREPIAALEGSRVGVLGGRGGAGGGLGGREQSSGLCPLVFLCGLSG